MKRWSWLGILILFGLSGCLAWLSCALSVQAAQAPELRSPPALQAAVLQVQPPPDPIAVGQRFTVTLQIENLSTPLTAFQLDLTYDATLLRVDDVAVGSVLRVAGRNQICPSPAAPVTGTLRFACATAGAGNGPTGSGPLAYVSMTALHEGTSPLTVEGLKLAGPNIPPAAIAATPQNSQVIIKPLAPPVKKPWLYLPFIVKDFTRTQPGMRPGGYLPILLRSGAQEVQR